MLKLQSNKNKALSEIIINDRLIVRVTKNVNLAAPLRKKAALIYNNETQTPYGFAAVLYKNDNYPLLIDTTNHIVLSEDLSYLDEGDVIRITNDLKIKAIYRTNSNANYFMVTERCNSFCIMCSQPPREINDEYLINEYLEAIPLIDRSANEIGITGGEPTLLGEKLIEVINKLKCYLPQTSLHILTNGKSFSDQDWAIKIANTKHHDMMFGIPLYSDIPSIHDYVVQSKGSFQKTLDGIINLKRVGLRIELRVVIHAQTANRLSNLARFIARNIQFVDQVSLMGLEVTGFAKANLSEILIDPIDYQQELIKAVKILDKAQIKTLIFNHQLCLLDRSLWGFSVKSISDWKNRYVDECKHCRVKEQCGGFFATSKDIISENIKAIIEPVN